jgi:hypothetical protein
MSSSRFITIFWYKYSGKVDDSKGVFSIECLIYKYYQNMHEKISNIQPTLFGQSFTIDKCCKVNIELCAPFASAVSDKGLNGSTKNSLERNVNV